VCMCVYVYRGRSICMCMCRDYKEFLCACLSEFVCVHVGAWKKECHIECDTPSSIHPRADIFTYMHIKFACVCVCLYMHAEFTLVCVHVYRCARRFYMCVYVFAYMNSNSTCVNPPCVHASTLCAHTGTCIHMYVCMCGYRCIHVYIHFVYTCIHVF